jgi:hypothetical protein
VQAAFRQPAEPDEPIAAVERRRERHAVTRDERGRPVVGPRDLLDGEAEVDRERVDDAPPARAEMTIGSREVPKVGRRRQDALTASTISDGATYIVVPAS